MNRGHVESRWMAVEEGGQRRLRGGRSEHELEGAWCLGWVLTMRPQCLPVSFPHPKIGPLSP